MDVFSNLVLSSWLGKRRVGSNLFFSKVFFSIEFFCSFSSCSRLRSKGVLGRGDFRSVFSSGIYSWSGGVGIMMVSSRGALSEGELSLIFSAGCSAAASVKERVVKIEKTIFWIFVKILLFSIFATPSKVKNRLLHISFCLEKLKFFEQIYW